MVYLPSNKAARAKLSELNMCVYIYIKLRWKSLIFWLKLDGMQEHANHVSGWILSTFCEVHARKNAFRYPGTELGKGRSFWKKFSNVEMFKMKNNTITVIWFLYDVQNYADLRWASFYSIWIIFHIVLYLIQ